MSDITDPATRSRMMSGIRGQDTQPELAVRSALHAAGLRFRLHEKGLPGRPDLVLPRHKVVVFVHGCFWHQHGCANSRLPKSRPEFWGAKLKANAARDEKTRRTLLDAGWRVATIWECSIRHAVKAHDLALYTKLANWIRTGTDKEVVL